MLDIGDADGSAATAALSVLDDALDATASARAQWGAANSRLDAAVEFNLLYGTNLSAARGRILDADIAAETANQARLSLLLESTTAMLAQANANRANVVALLLDL